MPKIIPLKDKQTLINFIAEKKKEVGANAALKLAVKELPAFKGRNVDSLRALYYTWIRDRKEIKEILVNQDIKPVEDLPRQTRPAPRSVSITERKLALLERAMTMIEELE